MYWTESDFSDVEHFYSLFYTTELNNLLLHLIIKNSLGVSAAAVVL